MTLSIDSAKVPVAVVPVGYAIDPARQLLTVTVNVVNAAGGALGQETRKFATGDTNWGGDCVMFAAGSAKAAKLNALISALNTMVGAL